jgi:hypothetical protein
MNKLYISLSVFATLALSIGAVAQTSTTITAAASPTVGYIYNMAADTTPADMPSFTVSVGSTTAQTWDFSQDFSAVYGSPVSFVAPAGKPGATTFPNSNLAVNQGGNNWGYLIAGTNGLFIDGGDVSVQGTSAALDFIPNPPQLPTPFTIGTTTTVVYTASTTTTYSSNTVLIKHHGVRTVTADAFGMVTTPAGTYSNTLRVLTHEITWDSISVLLGPFSTPIKQIYDTTTNYSWYQNTPDALVMSIDQSTAGKTTKAQYLQTFSNAINTIKHADFAANLYPNPTNTITNLAYENATAARVSASIFDLTGRQVATLLNNQQQAAGKQTLTVDVANLQLPQGLYMVQLTINGTTKTLKLNIQ